MIRKLAIGTAVTAIVIVAIVVGVVIATTAALVDELS